MTIMEDGGKSWADALAQDPTLDESLARITSWQRRSGGTITVRDAERVGRMVVLHGVEDRTGHPISVSVPMSEIGTSAA